MLCDYIAVTFTGKNDQEVRNITSLHKHGYLKNVALCFDLLSTLSELKYSEFLSPTKVKTSLKI